MRKKINVGRLVSLAVALAIGAGCAGGNALRHADLKHKDLREIIDYVVDNPESRSLNFIELFDRRLVESGHGHEVWAEYTERYYEGDKIYEMIESSKEHDVGNMSLGREFRCPTRINDPWKTPILIRYFNRGSGDESFEVTYQNREGETVTVGESIKFFGEFSRHLDGIPEVVGSLEGVRGVFVPFFEMRNEKQGKVMSDYQLILRGLNRAFTMDRR